MSLKAMSFSFRFLFISVFPEFDFIYHYADGTFFEKNVHAKSDAVGVR